MNEHSLIYIKSMAKKINEDKIERIRESAIELIYEKGYGGASIAAIATKANVSTGYLYRFYNSKYELVSDLLNTLLSEIIQEIDLMLQDESSIIQISERLVDFLFEKAIEKPYHIKFLYSLITEYKFKLGDDEKRKILSLSKQMLELGRKSNTISEIYDEEEVFLMMVIYPIEFISLRFKKLFSNKKLSNKDKERVHTLCINALKN